MTGSWLPERIGTQGEEMPTLTNAELAGIFFEIADLLELKGELPFRVAAYRRAAASVEHASTAIVPAIREGRMPQLAGVGTAISEKLAELADTGRLGFHERLREEVPPTLVTLLAVPGIGPRTAGDLWRQLGVRTLEELEAAARDGRLRQVHGLGARTEAAIAAGLAELTGRPPRRMHMARAHGLAERVRTLLAGLPEARAAHVVGSVRRFRETVGDIDIVLETDHPEDTLAGLTSHASIAQVAARHDLAGAARVILHMRDGPQVDVMIAPTGRAGAALVHLTGSAEHDVRLRQRARELGWSLSEHGARALDGGDGQARAGAPETRTFEQEADVYAFLGLPFIAPELREDRGEIEAGLAGRLPGLVSVDDLQGDCHSHSDWSDGRESIEALAQAARRRGYAYQVLTDHSRSLTIARGLTPDQVRAQGRIVGELNERFAREEARGEAPPGSHRDGFRLLHGCELEITRDGGLDYADEILARFDVVVASLHVGRRQPRDQLMARYLVAMRNPNVDILAHPSGRKIGLRADLDLDWQAFYRAAAETGTLLEVNGSDERLDLDEERVREALEAGCHFVIDSDAHWLDELDNVRWGVGVARRGWLEPSRVANTLPREAFTRLLGSPGSAS